MIYTPIEMPEYTQVLRDEINDVWRNEKEYYKKKYSLKVYNNQLEIVDTILNPLNHKIAIVQARGGGKCVVGDSLIFTDKGLIEIGDLCKTTVAENIEKLEMNVYSKDKEVKTSHLYYDGERETIKINTQSGYEIEGTHEHPVYIFNQEGKFEFKKISELKIGDMVCVQRGQNYFSKQNPELIFKFKTKSKNNTHKVLNTPNIMSLDLARFLAYLVAEGHTANDAFFIFTNSDKNLLQDYKNLLYMLFGIKDDGYIESSNDNKTYSIRVNSIYIQQFLKYCGVKQGLSKDKEIPWCVLQSNKDIVTEFFKTLFECEGSVSSKSVTITTASERMSKQIQIMLTNYGIISYRKCKYKCATNGTKIKRPYYDIIISGHNIDIFSNEIGMVSQRKTDKLKKIVGIKRNTNNDIIPYVNQIMISIYNKYKIKDRNKRRYTEHKGIQIFGKKAWKYIKTYAVGGIKGVTYNKLICLQCFLKDIDLQKILDYNFFFTPIIKIEQSQNKTYDFVVPTYHNFNSNGIISHNTFSVALALIEICQSISDMKIGIFAPKLGQSKKMIKQIYDIIKVASVNVKASVDTANSSSETIRFFNGSIIETSSANERTMSEGAHYHIIVIDEAHLVSDYSMSSKILPMLGSYKYRQLIKIGVAMFKNHFHSAFNNTQYSVVKRDWTECDILKEAGVMTYTNDKGETKEYPIAVIDNMPNEAKKKYFPDRPDLITGTTDLSYLDFMMQYELQWLDDISLLLNEKHQKQLVGIHDLTLTPQAGGIYVFGLDTAGGSVDPETLSLDYTSLSIWEVRNNQLLKVYAEQWQGSPMQQYAEIKERLKRFKVRYGLIDYSNIGIGFVEQFVKDQIRCEGIMYAKMCPDSKKDYKTTMFENFINKLEVDQIKYPKAIEKAQYDQMAMLNPQLATTYITNDEHFYQWCILERVKSKRSIKMLIEAPRGHHDDGCLEENTIISLTDGNKYTIKQLSKMDLSNKYAYSIDLTTNLIKQGKIKRCWKTGNKKIIKIVLDNNKYLECTEDHPIMMRDGTYKEACYVKSGDSLMPLYRKYSKGCKHYSGYEMIKCLVRGKYVGTHKMFALGLDKNSMVVHHKDYNKLNNNPENLIVMASAQHVKLHNNYFWENMSKEQKTERNKKGWTNFSVSERRKRLEPALKASRRVVYGVKRMSDNAKKMWQASERHIIQSEKLKKYWAQMTPEQRKRLTVDLVMAGANARKGQGSWNKGKKMSLDSRLKLSNSCKGRVPWNKGIKQQEVFNHKVKYIIDENKYADVYDIEIEKYHNFAVDSGIFVHNCNSDVLACYAVNKVAGKLDNAQAFNFLVSKSTFFSQ